MTRSLLVLGCCFLAIRTDRWHIRTIVISAQQPCGCVQNTTTEVYIPIRRARTRLCPHVNMQPGIPSIPALPPPGRASRELSEEVCRIIVLPTAAGDTDVETSQKVLRGWRHIWESGHTTLDARTVPRHHTPGLDKA